MRRALLVTLIAVTSGCAHHREVFAPDEVRVAQLPTGPTPVLVMFVLNPWLAVIGSDTPRFALYDDGTVIFVARGWDGRPHRLETAKLTPAERDALLASLRLERLDALEERYEMINATDMPTTVVITWPGGKPRSVSVYGVLDSEQGQQVIATTMFGEARTEPAPDAFVDIYKRLRDYSKMGATEWKPTAIEVMVWPWDYARESIRWPAGWPDLNAAVEQPGEHHIGMIYVDGAGLPSLREFLERRTEYTAVEMNGRKMSVGLRYLFPGEKAWKPVLPKSH